MVGAVPVGMAARLDEAESFQIVEQAAVRATAWLQELVASGAVSRTQASEKFEADFDVWMRLLGR